MSLPRGFWFFAVAATMVAVGVLYHHRTLRSERTSLAQTGAIGIAENRGRNAAIIAKPMEKPGVDSIIFETIKTCKSDKECLKLGDGWRCDIEHLTPEDVGYCAQWTPCKEHAECSNDKICLIYPGDTVGECASRPRTDLPVLKSVGGGPVPTLTPLEYERLLSANRAAGLLTGTPGGCGNDGAARAAVLMGYAPAKKIREDDCVLGPCDHPDMRNRYANPDQVIPINITFHQMMGLDEKYPVRMQDLAAAVHTLNEHYFPAKIKFEASYELYWDPKFSDVLVGGHARDCERANDLLFRKHKFSLHGYAQFREVSSNTFTDGFKACLEFCGKKALDCSGSDVWCGIGQSDNGYSVIQRITLPYTGYYVVRVGKFDHRPRVEFHLEVQWLRTHSCLSPMEYASLLKHDVPNSINVYVANFVPRIINGTKPTTRVTLKGFAYPPWTGKQLMLKAFMNPRHIGAGMVTLSHEIGHVFGLWHTFHGVSELGDDHCYHPCAEHPDQTPQDRDLVGDLCGDTMPTSRHWGCHDPLKRNPCTGQPWKDTPFDNLMSYGDDVCRKKFTPQQIARMRCHIDQLVNYEGT